MKNKISNFFEDLKKSKKNSLKIYIWLFIIGFSIFILCFLWLFQIIFLGTYYKSYKTEELDKAATDLRQAVTLDTDTIENIDQKRDICIEIYGNNTYVSTISNKGCMEFGNRNFKVKKDFIDSGLLEQHYNLINDKFQNETLIYALKLDKNIYAFINASLEPLDSTITILSNQFIFTTVIVLILSLVIGYFISRKLSKPITKISDEASINETVKTDPINSEEGNTYLNTVSSKIWSFACYALIFAVICLLFPKIITRISDKYEKVESGEVIEVFTKGLLTLILLPIIGIMLFMTVIGLPLGVIGLIFYGVAIYLSTIFTAYLLGYKIWQKVFNKDMNMLLIGLIGLFVLLILNLIPGINYLVAIITIVIGLGLIFDSIKASR